MPASWHHTFELGARSISPLPPYSQPPTLQVQTPLNNYQSAYTLAVPLAGPSTHGTYEREPSIMSTSTSNSHGSSLTPSNSVSVRSIASLAPGPATSSRSRRSSRVASFTSPALDMASWSDARQMRFEEKILRLTASAGFPLSWVENPEWLNFCTEFIPQAKSPSRKVLTKRLLPRTLTEMQKQAKERVHGQNVTASCDGWTGKNFHHYIAFMIVARKEVIVGHCSTTCNLTNSDI